MPQLTALILMPYSEQSRGKHDLIEYALELEEIKLLRLDDIRPGALWTTAVTDAIKKADFIIADLTEQSPNLMYEIGFAHALEKPVFLIISGNATSNIPSDLAGYHYLIYKDERELRNIIRDRIIRYLGNLRRPDVTK